MARYYSKYEIVGICKLFDEKKNVFFSLVLLAAWLMITNSTVSNNKLLLFLEQLAYIQCGAKLFIWRISRQLSNIRTITLSPFYRYGNWSAGELGLAKVIRKVLLETGWKPRQGIPVPDNHSTIFFFSWKSGIAVMMKHIVIEANLKLNNRKACMWYMWPETQKDMVLVL